MGHKGRLRNAFTSGIWWNLAGSLCFESLKFVHQLILVTTLGIAGYGQVGQTFSFIYLTLHLVDFEAASSLLPFLPLLKKSQIFLLQFLGWYAGGNMVIVMAGTFLSTWIASFYFGITLAIPTPLVVGIILCESLRILLRFFLNTVFVSRPTVIIDMGATLCYFLSIWIPLLKGKTPSLISLFVPYALASFGAVICMIFLVIRFAETLPPQSNYAPPKGFLKTLLATRCLNYSAHMSKYFFTGNFLTLLFAHQFGLAQAGLLKFASYIADGTKAFINVSIGFSGSALLAHVKEHSFSLKRQVFTAIWKAYNKILYPLIIFFAINCKHLFLLWSTYRQELTHNLPGTYSHPIIAMAILLLVIAIMENFFLVYEEFYLIEEQTSTLVTIKLFELTLFALALWHIPSSAPALLCSILLVRLITFCSLVLHAYNRWSVTPSFTIPTKHLAWTLLASLLFFALF